MKEIDVTNLLSNAVEKTNVGKSNGLKINLDPQHVGFSKEKLEKMKEEAKKSSLASHLFSKDDSH